MFNLKETKHYKHEKKFRKLVFIFISIALIATLFFTNKLQEIRQLKDINLQLEKKINLIKQENLKLYYKINYLNEILQEKSSSNKEIHNQDLIEIISYFGNFYMINLNHITLNTVKLDANLYKDYKAFSITIDSSSKDELNVISFLLALESNLRGINVFEKIKLSKKGNLYSCRSTILLFIKSSLNRIEPTKFLLTKKPELDKK